MIDWEYNKENKMASFDCLHFDPTSKNNYSIWVFPEMEFSCAAFKPGDQTLTIKQQREIEQLKEDMIKKEKEMEAIQKELETYR
jgi:cyclopropane fatty-acyl-phospholipid synthase-like methyltransferase